jgi:hypothetical protein
MHHLIGCTIELKDLLDLPTTIDPLFISIMWLKKERGD